MAVDAALVDAVRDGSDPALRLYTWSPACLSLGRNQPAAGHYDEELLGAEGIEVVRRPTGGRAVLHDRELTYSVIIPDRALGSPRDVYILINEVLAEALRVLGVAAHRNPEGQSASPPSLVPCFVGPAPGELLVEDRKIVGSAQARIGGVILQHGSIMVGRSPALDRIPSSLAGKMEGAPAYLSELTGCDVGRDEVVTAICSAWTAGIGPLAPGTLDDREVAAARTHARTFRDPAWTWRR